MSLDAKELHLYFNQPEQERGHPNHRASQHLRCGRQRKPQAAYRIDTCRVIFNVIVSPGHTCDPVYSSYVASLVESLRTILIQWASFQSLT